LKEDIKAALYDYVASGEARTMDAQFRGDRINLKVIKLRPDNVFLNHKNSRIMVELEAHPDYEKVMKDPQAPSSQLIIEGLLRATPAYEVIRDEVKEFKQREPGTISVDGRVINGNTRVVALRELGWDGFDAGVLPENATDDDFKEIELGLQLVDFTKQKYSFVNRLRQFEIMLQSKPTDEICRLMGWKRKKTQQFDEFKSMLDLVNEFSELGVPKLFFNSKEEYVKDLAAKIQALQNAGKLKESQQIKNLRLSGMLLGNSKDEVRNMDIDFIRDYLAPRAENSPEVSSFLAEANQQSPVADDFSDLFPTTSDPTSYIVEQVIELKESLADSEILESLTDVFRLAGDDAIQANKKNSRNALPQQSLNKLFSDINQLRAKIKDLADKGELNSVDDQSFDAGVRKVEDALELLQTEFHSLSR
jgi:hypothetical protein